jgi:hypothetical protein
MNRTSEKFFIALTFDKRHLQRTSLITDELQLTNYPRQSVRYTTIIPP